MAESFEIVNLNMELWQIVAIYLYYLDSSYLKGYRLKELLNGLKDIMKKKYPTYPESKYTTLLRDDGINVRCQSYKRREKTAFFNETNKCYYLNEAGRKWVEEEGKKLNIAQKSLSEETENKTTIFPAKQTYLNKNITQYRDKKIVNLTPKLKKLKERIIKEVSENKIYVLGQIKVSDQEFIQLKNYAEESIEKDIISGHGDILLITAIIKRIQQGVKNDSKKWKTIKSLYKNCKNKERLNKAFIETIKYYNKNKGAQLYLDNSNDKMKNIKNIKAHCFVFPYKLADYFSEIQQCVDANCALNTYRERINISSCSKHTKNVIITADDEQLKNLLTPLIKCCQAYKCNKEIASSDYFASKFVEYKKDPNLFRDRHCHTTENININDKPCIKYRHFIRKFEVYIPAQPQIKTSVDIEICSDNQILMTTKCRLNNSQLIQIDNIFDQYLFKNIKINIKSQNYSDVIEIPCSNNQYRFFDKNGNEKSKKQIANNTSDYLFIFVKKDISFSSDSDYEKIEGTSSFYDLYRVTQKNKLSLINNEVIPLSKEDIFVSAKQYPYLRPIIDSKVCKVYTTLPTIVINDVIKSKNNLQIKDSSNKIVSFFEITANTEPFIKDLNKDENKNLFVKNNFYTIEFNNKTVEKFLIIDDIDIQFEKDLYTTENEIFFTTNQKIKDIKNVDYIGEKCNRHKYKYTVESFNKDKPVYYSISTNNQNYIINIEIPFLKYCHYENELYKEFLLKDNQYFIDYNYRRNENFTLLIPKDIKIDFTPKLLVQNNYNKKTNEIEAKYENGYYCFEKIKQVITDDEQNQAYCLNLTLILNNRNIEIGKYINYPECIINFSNNNGIKIKIETDFIENFPKLFVKVTDTNNNIDIEDEEKLFEEIPPEEIDSNFEDGLWELIIPAKKVINKHKYNVSVFYYWNIDTKFNRKRTKKTLKEAKYLYEDISSNNPKITLSNIIYDNFLSFNASILPSNTQAYIYLEDTNTKESAYYKIKNKNSIKIEKNIEYRLTVSLDKNASNIPFFIDNRETTFFSFISKPYDIEKLKTEFLIDEKEQQLENENYIIKNIEYLPNIDLYKGNLFFEKRFDSLGENLIFNIQRENNKYRLKINEEYNKFKLVYYPHYGRYRLSVIRKDSQIREGQYNIKEMICK